MTPGPGLSVLETAGTRFGNTLAFMEARRHVKKPIVFDENYSGIIDRLGRRLLRCGVCRQRCREVYDVRPEREWRDLSMRKLPWKLRYRPRRVECPRCAVRVEDFPWAEPWARVTTTLANAVAVLAHELSWQGTAREYGLRWKSVAAIVKRAVQYGLRHRSLPQGSRWVTQVSN